MIECLVYDRSPGGARLRLVGEAAIPQCFRLYDDETETFATAKVAWRQARNIGVRFMPATEVEVVPEALAAKCKRYYAVGR